MSPVGALVSVASTTVLAVDPMTTPTADPVYLDSGQFAYVAIAAGFVVFLLAVIAVGLFRR